MGDHAAAAPPGAEELLAHTDWLMQLARALVGDAAAGDVVQETYEVALTKPPKRAGPLRPWLGGVARNVAKMSLRGGARRARREEAIAPAADVPTPEELVTRVQMQQRVARVVLDLGEPLRSTLLLRFFEGLTAAEIARAQGIPAATVRSRLKDALDRVRATLDAEHGGDRQRWAALLVPLAGPYGAGPVVGGLLVKTSLKVLVGIVIALVVVVGGVRWLGWWGGGDDAKPAPAAAVATGSAAKPVVVAPPAAPARGGARELPIVYDDDPKGTLRLEGQVIDDKDQPVAGARVAIDANPPIVVETEGDGSFVFEHLISRDYRIEATAGEGYAGPARLRLVDKAEPITLRMRRGAIVEVVVTDRQGGAPIAGAEVELRATLTWRATTNAEGVAQLRGLGAVWAPVAVRAAGFAPTAMMVGTAATPGATERVAIALARGAALAGRVVDEAGKPVGGARVVATSASEPLPVVDPRRDGVLAGADGTFTIPAVSAGTWRLTASHGDHAPATSAPITVDGVHPRRGIELALVAGGVVRGVVRDKAGTPVAGADIRVVARGHVDWRARRQAFSDRDGRFAITGLARRAADVVAWHDSGASAIVPAELATQREHDLELVLDISGAITGTVVDGTGAPIGDAQVIAEPDDTGGTTEREVWSVRGIQEAVTDQGGAFRFAGLPEGAYRIRAARPGASEAALSLAAGTVARPGGPPVKLVVAADGRVLGKLQLPDGKPPAAFALALGWTHPTTFATKDGSFAHADGAFVLSGFPPSTITVVAGKPGAGRSASIRIPPGPDSATLDLVLAPTGGLEGMVTRNGAPLADTVVIANPVGATASNFFVTTGPDGTFTLDALAPGPYIVYPMLGGGGGRPKDMYTRRVEVTLDARAKVEIDTTPGPITLAITVKTDKGTPVPMAQVIAFAAPIDPKSVTELRDGDMLAYKRGEMIPIYLRGARNGSAEIDGARPGPHTICALLGNPMLPALEPKYKCTAYKVTAVSKQIAIVTIPADWVGSP